MPAAAIAAVSAFGTAIGGAAGAALIMNAVVIGNVLFYAGAIALGNAQAAHQRRKAIRAYNASLQDRLVMVATADGARSRVYGRVRITDGVLFKATRGTNKESYTLVVALAGHEIDAVEQVYFDDVALTLDGSGYVTNEPFVKVDNAALRTSVSVSGGVGSVVLPSTPVAGSTSVTFDLNPVGGDGQVLLAHTVSGSTVNVNDPGGYTGTATVNYQAISSAAKARVRAYLGGAGQDLSSVLAADFPSLITSGVHRFEGIACLVVDLTYDQDAHATGVPNITAVVRGAKLLDPRTSTTAWTQNPALIARDWALHANGCGLPAGAIDTASFNAAANACDVVHGFVTDGVTTNRPLYTCGIALKTDQDPWGGLMEIVESMAGKAGWDAGALRVVAGAWRAPAFALDDTWLSGAEELQIVPQPPMEEAVNIYRPRIADSAQAYVAVQGPEVRAAAYVTLDGRELPREIDMGGVTDTQHAQHVCGVMLRDTRNALQLKVPCNFRAYPVQLFDVGTVTLERFGFVAKQFEVVDRRFSLHGGIVLTLKETAASIYDPDASFNGTDDTPNTQLPSPTTVPTLGTLTVTSGTAALTDGSVLTRTRIQWPAIADESVRNLGRVEIQYWPALDTLPSGDWSVWEERGTALEAVIPALKAGTVYVFRGRAVNALGVKGKWSVYAAHRIGSVELIDTPQLAPAAATVLLTASGTNGSVAATEANIISGEAIVALCNVSYNNTTGATVTLQIEAQVYAKFDKTGTGGRYAWFSVEKDSGAAVVAQAPVSASATIPVAESTGDYRSYAMVANVSQAAGANVTYTLYAKAHVTSASSPATSVTNTYGPSTLRVTVIKR